MPSQPAPPPVARAVAAGEVRGALSAPASLPGALGIPIAGCQLSTGSPQRLVINYRPRTLRIDGRRRRASRISTTVRFVSGAGAGLGRSVGFSLRAGGREYRWSSVAGTLHVADGLRSGAFRARLRASSSAARSPLQLTGSWRRCHTATTL